MSAAIGGLSGTENRQFFLQPDLRLVTIHKMCHRQRFAIAKDVLMRAAFTGMIGILAMSLFLGNASLRGQQNQKSDRPTEPQTCYSKAGPIGQFFRVLKDDLRLKKVGVIGMGNGSLAAYSEPRQDWTFFEVDEDVKQTAADPKRFTFLRDAKGKVRIRIGDARLEFARSKDTFGPFGVLILDTFNSDAIPVHLLTREAIALYRKRLPADGILVFHITNRHLDLEPVLAKVADDAKSVAYSFTHSPSEKEKKAGVTKSQWVVIARHKKDLAPLLKTGSWQPARIQPGLEVWTDDYSNILKVLR